MKRIILSLLALTTVLGASAQQKNFTISGTLTVDSLRFTEKPVTELYLVQTIDGEQVVTDTAKVIDKKFRFEGVAPEFAELAAISGFDNGEVRFILESGNIVVSPFSARYPVSAFVGGTKNNEIFTAYMKLIDKNATDSRNRMKQLEKKLPEETFKDPEKFFPYQYAVYHSNGIYYKIDIMNYLLHHLDSEASLYMIRHGLYAMFTPKVVERQLLRAVPMKLRNHPAYLALVNQLRADNLKEGAPAPEIKGLTPDGKELTLSDLKGKYVLLDFWASWCGPCRREFPFIHEALAASEGSDNFVILSYSIDSKHADWVNCIENNNLKHKNWHHISVLKGWDSEGAKLYGVDGVPHTVLLNPDGRVVAFNLRGEEMVKKVKNILAGKESYK